MGKVTDSISSYRLFEAITNLSVAVVWEEAKKEWYLAHIEIADDNEVAENTYVCACGHPHLKELCYIRNKKNGNEVLVGNCCVKKFMELESDKIFQAVKRKRVNPALVEYAAAHNWISPWERSFLLGVARKRKFSQKQKAVYDRLSEKIFAAVGA